jgi:hypothetical protein
MPLKPSVRRRDFEALRRRRGGQEEVKREVREVREVRGRLEASECGPCGVQDLKVETGIIK